MQQRSAVHVSTAEFLFLQGSCQLVYGMQVVRKPEEGDFIGHLRAEGLMEIARIFQVCQLSFEAPFKCGLVINVLHCIVACLKVHDLRLPCHLCVVLH